MTNLSKTSFGWIGLLAFTIGIVCPVASEWIPNSEVAPISDWLLFIAPGFWLLGLGCGIASRTYLVGKVAIWTNGVPLVLLALWVVWIQFFPIRFG